MTLADTNSSESGTSRKDTYLMFRPSRDCVTSVFQSRQNRFYRRFFKQSSDQSPGTMASACANPLLLEWIKEWYDLAKERNTKGVTTYKKAYESMKACPLTFSHPSEAQQLDGIGPKICDRLTEKLKEHCEANGLPAPKKPRGKG